MTSVCKNVLFLTPEHTHTHTFTMSQSRHINTVKHSDSACVQSLDFVPDMSGISSVCVCERSPNPFPSSPVCVRGDVMESSLSSVICSVRGSVMSCRGRSGQASLPYKHQQYMMTRAEERKQQKYV